MNRIGCAAAAFAACGVVAAGVAFAAAASAERAGLEALSGVYASNAPEPWYGGHGTRQFTFGGGTWSLAFTHALDGAMQNRTFTFRTGGPYKVGEESKAVPGAFEAIFYEDVKYVTLLTADAAIIRAFGFANCGLKLNVEVDISKTGCASWKPVSECREDHDLLAVRGHELFFGVRPRDNNMCTADRRPTALLPAVTRQ